ncbi:hypothetical protein OKW28_000250 [Paraburkholderia sp. 40]
MCGKERFDPPGTTFTETGDHDPPSPAAGNSDSQVGQRPDAVPMQYRNVPGREPGFDRIAHKWSRDRK